MSIAHITQHIDIAQMVLYVFWIFFAGLVIYLRREDKREGYPLDSDRNRRGPGLPVIGFPSPPEPKRWKMGHGEPDRIAPRPEKPESKIFGVVDSSQPLMGNPMVPTGNPLRDGVGPASFSQRRDLPDRLFTGDPKVQPMKVLPDYQVMSGDPDPRGMPVIAADGVKAGTVTDLWLDRAEPRILYYQVELEEPLRSNRRRAFAQSNAQSDQDADHPQDQEAEDQVQEMGDQNQEMDNSYSDVLVPVGLAKVQARRNRLSVASLMAVDFAFVPELARPDVITRLEEERITAYFAGGHLYRGAGRAAESA